jgi:sugar phosphate isomerase/epimerase
LLKVEPGALDEFYRFAQLAKRFRTPYLRVFGMGGSMLGESPDASSLAKAAETINELRAHLREQECSAEILIETHDVFSASDRCLALNAHLDHPVKILWDSFHTWNLGGESPRESWSKLGPWIAHVHHHDCANPPGSGDTGFVPSGQGRYPCEDLRTLLQEKHYRGGLSLEWEKLWHPELPPVGEVLGDFVQVFGR